MIDSQVTTELEDDDESHFNHLKTTFSELDDNFFKKSQFLCQMDISAEQLGCNRNYAIPLTASIVELSMIDRYPTAIGKLDCICSTYDMLYAELKTGLIEMISLNSEDDNAIPVIESCEIIPLLKTIILKSKLRNAFSTLHLIRKQCSQLFNGSMNKILEDFETAVEDLANMDCSKIISSADAPQIRTNISALEYIRIAAAKEGETEIDSMVKLENNRIFKLISQSTEELFITDS